MARRRAVEAHLNGCAGCRAELAALRRTLSLMANLPRRVVGDGFDAALQARLEAVRDARQDQVRGIGVRSLFPRAASSVAHPFLLPAGALAVVGLALFAGWSHHAVVLPAERPAPAYVQAMVAEHQRLPGGGDLSATVVSHNLGGEMLGEGDEE